MSPIDPAIVMVIALASYGAGVVSAAGFLAWCLLPSK